MSRQFFSKRFFSIYIVMPSVCVLKGVDTHKIIEYCVSNGSFRNMVPDLKYLQLLRAHIRRSLAWYLALDANARVALGDCPRDNPWHADCGRICFFIGRSRGTTSPNRTPVLSYFLHDKHVYGHYFTCSPSNPCSNGLV